MTYYLLCDHCYHANEIKSGYLTFCEICGKKITQNFNDWIKENPGKSLDDFKSAVCHPHLLHWESDTQVRAEKNPSRKSIVFLLFAVAGLILATAWGILQGPEVAGNIEEWALRKIQFSAANTEIWEVSIIQEGNFQIKFPSKPEKIREFSETVTGTISHCNYRVKPPLSEDENLVYTASFMAFPPEVINSRVISNQQVEQFLKYTIDGLVKREGGILRSEKNIAYGLFPGKEIKMDFQNGLATVKCRLYLVDNTLYTLRVTTAIQNTGNKATDYFLNSFKLLEYAGTRNSPETAP